MVADLIGWWYESWLVVAVGGIGGGVYLDRVVEHHLDDEEWRVVTLSLVP